MGGPGGWARPGPSPSPSWEEQGWQEGLHPVPPGALDEVRRRPPEPEPGPHPRPSREARRALSDAISCCKPSVCDKNDNINNAQNECTLMGVGSKWDFTSAQFLVGPLSAASSIAEYLLLLYINGMDSRVFELP